MHTTERAQRTERRAEGGVHIHYRRFHIASLYVILHGLNAWVPQRANERERSGWRVAVVARARGDDGDGRVAVTYSHLLFLPLLVDSSLNPFG
jgi:hypothetical protein